MAGAPVTPPSVTRRRRRGTNNMGGAPATPPSVIRRRRRETKQLGWGPHDRNRRDPTPPTWTSSPDREGYIHKLLHYAMRCGSLSPLLSPTYAVQENASTYKTTEDVQCIGMASEVKPAGAHPTGLPTMDGGAAAATRCTILYVQPVP